MATVVDVAGIRAWSGMSATSVTNEQLEQVLQAELALQAMCCTVPVIDPPPTEPTLPEPLAQAIYRRCAREVALRSLPLGTQNDIAEYGPVTMPSYDAEIERLEAPYRKVAVA